MKKTIQIKLFNSPYTGYWTVMGATTGLAIVFMAGYILGQSSVDTPVEKADATKKPMKNYVFCTVEGKTVVLNEFDVNNIKQLHEEGVFPNVIAERYNTSVINICRIINSLNSIKV